MRKIENLLRTKYVGSIARVMGYICRIVMIVLLFGLALSLIGRQTFTLRTNTGTYENAM